MRALFFLLLLSNVVLFVYLQWLSPAEEPAPQPPYPAGGSLVLLSEEEPRESRDDAPARAAIGDRAPALISNADAICYRSPPFDSEQAARAGIERDALDAARTEIRQEQASVSIGYWVYLGPEDSGDAVEQRLAELTEAGVQDVGIVNQEPYSNTISLGVFSNEERARQRRDAIAELGFDVETGERDRLETRYYIFAEWPRQPTIIPSDWRQVDCQS